MTRIMLEVPDNLFILEPEVTSSVIKFDVLKKPRIDLQDEKKFFKLIKTAFMQKRKTLVNSLVNGGIFKTKEEAKKVLKELGIDVRIRAQKLTLDEYKKIDDKT